MSNMSKWLGDLATASIRAMIENLESGGIKL